MGCPHLISVETSGQGMLLNYIPSSKKGSKALRVSLRGRVNQAGDQGYLGAADGLNSFRPALYKEMTKSLLKAATLATPGPQGIVNCPRDGGQGSNGVQRWKSTLCN